MGGFLVAREALKVFMVTSEAVPFAKAGGLGDVVSSLSLALSNLGLDIKIIMPRYYFINPTGFSKLEGEISVIIGPSEERASIWKTFLPNSRVPLYLLENEELYGRDGIYGSREEPSFKDNLKRFAFLSMAVFALKEKLGFNPDILHCHDWPSGLVSLYRNKGFLHWSTESSTVFTIHNLGYQGVFPLEQGKEIGFSREELSRFGLARGEEINLLQGALLNSDQLTTVSPTYAREIQRSEQGEGLEEILRNRSSDLKGILNGIDYSLWDPEKDKYLPFHYSQEELTNKARIKGFLQREMGLSVQNQVPLIGIVSRLVSQKGFVELCSPGEGALPQILENLKLQIVILGTGERWIEEELKKLSERYNNLKVRIGFDEPLAHLIEAGSDFFLMPSRYEPCGLNQLYSLRYGTLPIVRNTGGLADSVKNYSEETGEGTGFLFDSLSPKVLYDVVGWAVSTWYNRRSHINRMRKRAMMERYTWEKSAKEYIEVYKKALEKRKGGI